MDVLSWSEENEGKNGILITPYDHRPPYELFFSSRLELYFGLLGSLPLQYPGSSLCNRSTLRSQFPPSARIAQSAPTHTFRIS